MEQLRYFVRWKIRRPYRIEPLHLRSEWDWFDSLQERDAFIDFQTIEHGRDFIIVQLGDNSLELALKAALERDKQIARSLGVTAETGALLNPGRAQCTDEVIMGRRRW